MTTQTKFDVNQEVWLIYDRKAIQRTVNTVMIHAFMEGGEKKIEINYDLKLTPGSHAEEYLFPTKEALLQSL